MCYGWNLSTCRLVSLGESVGIIAAQSIGEPGTQLTMRTFHTGGVFSGQLLEQIKSPFSGFIVFNQTIAGQLVRTTHGQIAFLTKQDGVFNLVSTNNKLIKHKVIQIFKIPAYSLLFIKQNQKVKKNQILAESAKFFTNLIQNNQIYQTLYSQISGEVRFLKKKSISKFQFYSFSSNSEAFWILSAQKQVIFKKINLVIQNGDFVTKNNFIYFYYYYLLGIQIVFSNLRLLKVIKQKDNLKLIKKNINFFYFNKLKKFIKLLLYFKNLFLLKNWCYDSFLSFYFKYVIFEFFDYKNLLLKKKNFSNQKMMILFNMKIQKNLFKFNQVIKLNKVLKKKIFFFKKNYNIKIVNLVFYTIYFKLIELSFLLKKNKIVNEFKILLKTLFKLNFFIKKQIQNTLNYFLNKKNSFKNQIKKYKKNLYLKKHYLKIININKVFINSRNLTNHKVFQFYLTIFLIKNKNVINYICIIKTQKLVNFLLGTIFKKVLVNNQKFKFFLVIKFVYIFKNIKIFYFLNIHRINIHYFNNFFLKKIFQIKKIKNLFLKIFFIINKKKFDNKKNIFLKKIFFRFNYKNNKISLKKIYYNYLNTQIFNSLLIKKYNRCLIFSFELFFKYFDYYQFFYYLKNKKILKNLISFCFNTKNNRYKLQFGLTEQIIQIYLITYLKNKKNTFFIKKLKFKKFNFFIWIFFLNLFLNYISFLKKLSKITKITKKYKFKEINNYIIFKKLYFFTIYIFNTKNFFITKYQVFLNNIAIYLNLVSQLKSKILIDYFNLIFKKSTKNIFKLLLLNDTKNLFIKDFDFMYFKLNLTNFKFNRIIWTLKKKIISSILLKKQLHKYYVLYNLKLNQTIILEKPFNFNKLTIIKIPLKLTMFFLIKNNKQYWFNPILKIKMQKTLKNKIILKSYFIFNNVEIIKNNFFKFLKKFKIYLSFFNSPLIINKFIQLINNFEIMFQNYLILKFYLKLKKYFLIKLIITNNNYLYLTRKLKRNFYYCFKNQKIKNLILFNKILIVICIDYFLKKNDTFTKLKNKFVQLKEKQLVTLMFQNTNLTFKINFKHVQYKIPLIYFTYNIIKNSSNWIFTRNELSNNFFIHNKIISVGYYKINTIYFEYFILFNKIISIYSKKYFYVNQIINTGYCKIKNFLNFTNEFVFFKLLNQRFIVSKFNFFNYYIKSNFFIKINNYILKIYNYFYLELTSIKMKHYYLNNDLFIIKNKTHSKTNFCNLIIFTRQKKFKIINKYYRFVFLKTINLSNNFKKFNQNLKKKKVNLFIKKKKKLLYFFSIFSSKIIFNDNERYTPKLLIQRILFNLPVKHKNNYKKMICYNFNKLLKKKYTSNKIMNLFLCEKIKFILKNCFSYQIYYNLNNFKIMYAKIIFLISIKKNIRIKNINCILNNFNLKKSKKIVTKLVSIKNLVNNKLFFFNNNEKKKYKKSLLFIPINFFKNTNYLFKNFLVNPKINILITTNLYNCLQYNYSNKDFVELIKLFYTTTIYYCFVVKVFNLRNKIYYFTLNKQNILIQHIVKKIFINKNLFSYLTVSNVYNNLKQFKKGFSQYKGEVLKVVISNSNFKMLHCIKSKKLNIITIYYLTNQDIKTYKFDKKFYSVIKKSLGSFITYGTEIFSNIGIFESGQLLLINKNKLILRKAKCFSLASGGICDLQNFSFVNINAPLLTLTYKNLKTEDIVQGIPKIDQIFEARENLVEQTSLNNLIRLNFIYFKKIYNHQLAVRKSIEYIQQYIVNGIQDVYQSQGVNISDKHIEIIVKQMTSKVKIIKAGNTNLLRGDIVYLNWIEQINNSLIGQKVKYEPLVLGISKSSLEIEGFISAASFQETVKVLSRAAILQKQDFLCGLKENLILGQLLPTGTGFEFPVIFLKKGIYFFKNIKKK